MYKKPMAIVTISTLFLLCAGQDAHAAQKQRKLAPAAREPNQARPEALDAKIIEQAAGQKATTAPDGVVRLSWARDDVVVNVDGMPLQPAAGLGSWAAFKAMPRGQAMVMGDTVVFGDEITPAMDAAFAQGLNVTALHNHFLFDRPPVYFMHIEGAGSPEKLGGAVKAMWDAIKAVRKAQPSPQDRFPGGGPQQTGKFNVPALEKILAGKAEDNKGTIKFTFARTGTMHGVPVGGSMGLTTWASFSGNPDQGVIDGDFIMTAAEVQPVMRALRQAGIHIVALHNHMIGDQPPFYFLHFWGKGQPEQLAQGIKAALAAQQQGR
jgi:hypothetical protein